MLCVILRSRVLQVVCPHQGIGRQLPLELQCSYQGQQGDVSLCAETIKPVFEGDKIWQLWKEIHQFIKCILSVV